MDSKNIMSKIISKGVMFGVISIIITDAFFLLVYPSAWIFFIIPAFMAFCLTKYVKMPNEILQDEDALNVITKRVGIMVAAVCFFAVLIAILPLVIILESGIISHIISNFLFYIVCGVAIFTGYNRGIEIVTNAYYDSLS